MARMVRELELLNYDATMARCSNSALKLVIWWGNNIGGGTMLISEAELKESVELAIAYWKKQIVLCPYIKDNNKEWCKEFVETTVKKELEKLKMELKEVVTRQEDDTLSNKKIARIIKLSTAISRACVQFINRAHVRTRRIIRC